MKKTYVGHIWGVFCLKNPKLFYQRMFLPIFQSYDSVTPCKKIEKFNTSIWKLKKLILGHILFKTLVQDFSKKNICINFKYLCCYKFIKKSEKFHAFTFDYWKTLFWAQLVRSEILKNSTLIHEISLLLINYIFL